MYIRNVLAILCIASGLATLLTVRVAADPAPQQSPSPQPGAVGKFNGPGACAASSCHGGVQPKNITRIWQNEFSIWAAQDKHARAYSVLSNPVSLRMGKILQLEQPPNKTEKCLVCHSLYVPAELRAATFQPDDGVSCENCHGPAVGWLGPHTMKDWQHEQSVKLGMYDTRDLVKRAERCLTCHLGTPEKQVDHEMIAAGHPDLTFELDSFSAAMPRHWKANRSDDAWFAVQVWAVGEAVQLRESLNRLSHRASGPNWPEYAELDCFACHHSLTPADASWRQAVGYKGRRPGVPAWNASRYLVFRYFAAIVDPQTTQRMETALDHLSLLIGKPASPQEISSTALNTSALVDTLVQKIRTQRYDQDVTARIMLAIAGNSEVIAAAGERTAEQATMALDSLSIAYTANTKVANASELRAAINNLFPQLQSPSAYNAPQFRQQLQKVQALLPRPAQASNAGQ